MPSTRNFNQGESMNKREQQRKIKQEKQQAAKHKEQFRTLVFKIALFGVAPILALFVLFTLLNQGATYSPAEIAGNDHVRGDRKLPVSIVVYADFQCPACAIENETMVRLWPQLNDRAHLIFRHFPVTSTHKNTWKASLYAEAAARQGKFWEMHDYLFATQSLWSNLRDAESEFESYALELNLDIDRLQADMESDEVVAKIRNDQRGGTSAGVQGTPAVFINGRYLGQPTRQRILDIVEAEYSTVGT
tara:strand:+ start:5517 stop:6257 length:741 start_codon:yes stop_codon:yes gene_type:complete